MLGFSALGQFPLGAFQARAAVTTQVGPAYDRKRRKPIFLFTEEDEDRKALAKAEAALKQAEAAKKADTRRKAVEKVFAALKVDADREASLAQARAAVARMRAELAHRQEEEEFILLQLWAG
jgi:hypothetical protein